MDVLNTTGCKAQQIQSEAMHTLPHDHEECYSGTVFQPDFRQRKATFKWPFSHLVGESDLLVCVSLILKW